MKKLSILNKLAFKLAVVGLTVAASVGGGLYLGSGTAHATSYDCDSNAVIYCGASSVSVLQSRYKYGYGSSSATSIHNIYDWFGISSNDISSMSNTNAASAGLYEVAGTVTKSGDILVGNQVVATNALTAGRSYIYGSTQRSQNGTTFYTRTPSVSFLNSSLSAMVVMKNGVFQFAVLDSCGNPVSGQPKLPGYTISKQVRIKNTGSFVSNLSVMSGATIEYQITVSSTGSVPVNNVTVKDLLPKDVSYVNNSLARDGKSVSNGGNLFTTGILIPSLANGSKTVFDFYAVVAPNDTVGTCTPASMTNTGSIASPGLSTKSSSAVVSKQCQPKPVTYSCQKFAVSAGDKRKVTITDFAVSASNGATFSSADINWGDGSTNSSVSKVVGLTHTYSADKTYYITATVQFMLNGKIVSGSSVTCKAPVSFQSSQPVCPPGQIGTYPNCSTPQTCPPGQTGTYPDCKTVPTSLVNTGPGSVAAIFAGIAVVGGLLYRQFIYKRHRSLAAVALGHHMLAGAQAHDAAQESHDLVQHLAHGKHHSVVQHASSGTVVGLTHNPRQHRAKKFKAKHHK